MEGARKKKGEGKEEGKEGKVETEGGMRKQ